MRCWLLGWELHICWMHLQWRHQAWLGREPLLLLTPAEA